ncbi:hypothetical protein GW17_00041715 [Ensete ventricosum]|nr:hypothetical protein GW17_00041715 [Ensete ventricosum]RZR98885.1 hypothetical protein BHM03_00028339 [Ensete ventricosum]
MGLEFDVHELPTLAPIRTTGNDDPPKSTITEDVECVTPKSQEPVRALVCPPAPRKPRPAKRRLGPPPRGYYPVPSDLLSVFVPLPCPPSKKTRVADKTESIPHAELFWVIYSAVNSGCKTLDDLREVIACEIDIRCIRDYSARMQDDAEADRGGVFPGRPLYVQLLKAATPTMCPFCERMVAPTGRGGARKIKSGALDGMSGRRLAFANTGLLRLQNFVIRLQCNMDQEEVDR